MGVDGLISSPQQICVCFNNYFINKGNFNVTNVMSPPNTISSVDSLIECSPTIFRCSPIGEDELLKIINSFKSKPSSGYDEISIKLIKFVKFSLVKPLLHLINSSLISGIFPDKLKISKVIPVYKKGETTNLKNYRPISVLPSISKIFETVMCNRLVSYLEKNNFLDQEQHGFRKGKSTVTALIKFTESVVNSIENKNKVSGVFMDLSNAFDSLSHELLLGKLQKLGITGVCLRWMKSYLSNRLQYVEITHKLKGNVCKYKSPLQLIKYGVPQGSVLGPLLFICYLNGIPKIINHIPSIKSHCYLYADDVNLITSANTLKHLEDNTSAILGKLKTFFQEYNLKLNTQKTNFILFHTKQNTTKNQNIIIKIHNNELDRVENTKFLGLIIDSHLSWDMHIDYIIKKINSGLYALKRMRNFCNVEVLRTIYFAHIHSHIAYGICVYGATSKLNINKILILQKKSIRIILGLDPTDSVKPYFRQLKILTINSLYILECVCYMREHLSEFQIQSSVHSHDTRQKNQITIPIHRLEFFKKKTSYVGAKFLERIPSSIKSFQNNKTFKTKLKEYLMDRALYSLDEL